MRRTHTSFAGVTLMELALTIAIIGIVSAAGFSTLQQPRAGLECRIIRDWNLEFTAAAQAYKASIGEAPTSFCQFVRLNPFLSGDNSQRMYVTHNDAHWNPRHFTIDATQLSSVNTWGICTAPDVGSTCLQIECNSRLKYYDVLFELKDEVVTFKATPRAGGTMPCGGPDDGEGCQ